MREADRTSDFNSLAADYAKFRTSYSDELFNAILEYARTPDGGRVLDLACGTGLAMMQYLRRGLTVVGVDVAPAMIEQARHIVPASTAVELQVGRAEALPVPSASFDLISCAQAFHWFEPHAAFAECARVLRPGGALAIFWKHAARDDELTLVGEEIIRQWMGDDAALRSRDHAAEHEAGWDVFWYYAAPAGSRDDGRIFVDGEKKVIEFSLRRTPKEFVGYQRSREKIRTVLQTRREEFLTELERRLGELGPTDEPKVQRQVQYMFLARRKPSLLSVE